MSAEVLLPPQSSNSSPSSTIHDQAQLTVTSSTDWPDQRVSVQDDEPCGLTPASLKHLRRQRDALAEERSKLLSELAGIQATVREQGVRINVLEDELVQAEKRQVALLEDVRAARAAEEEQRKRASELELRAVRLEELLSQSAAEIMRLKEDLERQRLLTKEVCEAAEQQMEDKKDNPGVNSAEFREAQEKIRQLEADKEDLERRIQQQVTERDDMQRAVSGAMKAAEKAMAMHAVHSQRVETIRGAKLVEAINAKVELHISVPKVTLSYNNAPPLVVSVHSGLSEGKIRDFLDCSVFPHFEPLWVRLDGLDQAPDGSSKRAYSTKMLDRLTEAVKAFIAKAQHPDSSSGKDLSLQSAQDTASGGRHSSGEGASIDSLSGADRERLLHLLRSGDDRGLDSKLLQLMSGGRPPGPMPGKSSS